MRLPPHRIVLIGIASSKLMGSSPATAAATAAMVSALSLTSGKR